MERFHYGERVRVTDPAHHLYGREGTVIQVRTLDGCGRIEFDRALPDPYQTVLQGVRFARQSFLFPGHCERLRR